MPKSEGMSDIIRWQPYITPGRVRNNPLRAEELPQQETKPSLSLLPSAFNNQNERYLWEGPWRPCNPHCGRSSWSLIYDDLYVQQLFVFYKQMCLLKKTKKHLQAESQQHCQNQTHTSITKMLTLIVYIIYFLHPLHRFVVKVVLVAKCGAIRLKSFHEATLRDITSRKTLRAAARNANVLFRWVKRTPKDNQSIHLQHLWAK